MSYQDCDPFDNYISAASRFDFVQGTPVYSSSNARFPAPSPLVGQGIQCGTGVFVRKNLVAGFATLILGVAAKPLALPASGASGFMSLLDTGTQQITLAVTAAGALQFYRGTTTSGVAIGPASASGLIQSGVYHYFEIVVTINGSTGSVAVFVDQPAAGGVAAITATGLNTQNTANPSANQYSIGELSSNLSGWQFDDVYCFDTGGTTQNARLGDQRMYTEMPNGVGASTQWTPNGAASNWQCVSEIPPDGDTTYVSSSTPAQEDLYTTQIAGLGATAPNFVVVRRMHRKDDASTHTDQSAVRSGTTVATSTAVNVPSTYTFQDDIYPNDPNTSAPWASGTAADNAQIGLVETT